MTATKNRKEQLTFDAGFYAEPDSDISPPVSPAVLQSKTKAPRKARETVPDSLQPFLPGLSRRGRPRSMNPVPATVRATASRQRRMEAGTKRIELLLAPEIAADLDFLTRHFRVSRVELVSRLLAQTAKRIRRAENLSAAPSGRRSTS
jgi:hypothetical protein